MQMIRFMSSVLAFAGALALVAPAPAAWAEEGHACCFPNGTCQDKPDATSCYECGGIAFHPDTTCSEDCCEPRTTADCSPGYYKNHPEEWCSSNPDYPGSDLSRNCASGADCGELIDQLRTRGPGSEAVRNAAKGVLDTCFGTDRLSPCEDDD